MLQHRNNGTDEESLLGKDTIKIDTRQKRSPFSLGRIISLLMVPLVFSLMLLTVVPYYHFREELGLINVFVFSILLFLMTLSYLQIVYTDAGTVPTEWSQQAATTYPVCRQSKQLKPLRSHYCSISQRLVLNLDHFCPWTANAIGFRNRKFFILFVFYTMLTCMFAAASLGPIAIRNLDVKRTNMVMHAINFVAFVIDCTFSVALFFFSVSHFWMAAKNQTSVEGYKQSKRYDLGWRENFRTVFGKEERHWFIPLYFQGPLGDGVHWRLSDGSMDGFASGPCFQKE